MELELEYLGKIIVDSAFKVHKELGPGLLEKVYEACLEHELKKAGLKVQRQLEIPITYDGLEFDEGFRLDMLVSDRVIIELKAVDTINPLWRLK
jgi:GxxExxY protein